LLNDISLTLQQTVQDALANSMPLQIQGGNSKAFLGYPASGAILAMQQHRGVVNYHPSELIITARAGTALQEIAEILAEQHQMLAFDPPGFGASATLGGTIACGLSGSRRPFTGAARDFVLGCKMINGRGEILVFGGEVMKNVAGYDISRLMVGAMGTLGVLLEISLKVLPRPGLEVTRILEMTMPEALQKMTDLGLQCLPLSGLSYDGAKLFVRFSGVAKAVHAAAKKLGGETCVTGAQYWLDLQEQRLAFFKSTQNLWRLSVAPAVPQLALPGACYYDWGGALRWLKTDVPSAMIFTQMQQVNGSAMLFRSRDPAETRFQPLETPLQKLNLQVKQAFDPVGIFNPGRKFEVW